LISSICRRLSQRRRRTTNNNNNNNKISEIQKPIPEPAYLTDPNIHSETRSTIRRGGNVCRFSKISEIQKPIQGREASQQIALIQTHIPKKKKKKKKRKHLVGQNP
jgi:hypothetical protein